DRGMGVRRAQHIAVSLSGQVYVVLKAAVAAEEALILEAPHRLPDPELAHRHLHVIPAKGRDPSSCKSRFSTERTADRAQTPYSTRAERWIPAFAEMTNCGQVKVKGSGELAKWNASR